MNERQLEYFMAAADAGSFTKAADLSTITTPAFIQQINLLEESLGFSLFNRSHRGIALTKAGESFYPAAKNILALYEAARKKGQEIEKNHPLSLRIAYPTDQFPAFLVPAFEKFRTLHPNGTVDFVPIAFNEQLSAIQNGLVDLCIIAEPTKEALNGLTFYPLREGTYNFCMCPDHKLAKAPMITKNLLKGVNVLCGCYPYLKTTFTEQLKDSGARLHIMNKEYDMSARANSLLSDEVMVIDSLWSPAYESFLKVVPSNIPSGLVGAVFQPPASKAVKAFLPTLDYLKNN
jgi:DNA-binding transcriptional LysR family regulator